MVPVGVRAPSMAIRTRELHRYPDLLKPRHEINLMYAEDSDASSPLQYINIAAKHDIQPYVLIEEFEKMLRRVKCTRAGNGTLTSMRLTFKNARLLNMAQREWASHESLIFVSHHESCNDEAERAAYRSFSIHFDQKTLSAVIDSAYSSFEHSSEASSFLKITGGSSARDVAHTFVPRTFQKSTLSERGVLDSFQMDYGEQGDTKTLTIHANDAWPVRERLFDWAGFGLYCDRCHTRGEIRLSLSVGLRTDLLHLLPDMVQGSLQNEVMGKIFTEASFSVDVVEEVDINYNLDLSIDNGAFFRTPTMSNEFNVLEADAVGCLGVGNNYATDLGLTLQTGAVSWDIYSGFVLEAPAVQVCLGTARGVTEDCKPGGKLNGAELKLEVLGGLSGYASFAPGFPGFPIARIHLHPWAINLPPEWHRIQKLASHCFGSPDSTHYKDNFPVKPAIYGQIGPSTGPSTQNAGMWNGLVSLDGGKPSPQGSTNSPIAGLPPADTSNTNNNGVQAGIDQPARDGTSAQPSGVVDGNIAKPNAVSSNPQNVPEPLPPTLPTSPPGQVIAEAPTSNSPFQQDSSPSNQSPPPNTGGGGPNSAASYLQPKIPEQPNTPATESPLSPPPEAQNPNAIVLPQPNSGGSTNGDPNPQPNSGTLNPQFAAPVFQSGSASIPTVNI
ncbi:MAG: hypothetical protein M1829_005380 [Trizodia sp. TS-e1964]|nr:MAG: hypothetical protein M1829_005380 [Trizodia sp. TS-e1964]